MVDTTFFKNKGPFTLKQIAEDTCIGRTTVRNSINWLEENGYIERIKIHEDNRNSYRIFH